MVKKKSKGHSHIESQIWGIVYVAIAILVFVSLSSKLLNGTNNVLGPYLGTYMSFGLEYIFGPVTIFLLPIILGYIGKVIFEDGIVNKRYLLITFFFIIQTSTLAAIPNLDRVAEAGFKANGNAIGHIIARFLLVPIFGAEKFGPYFIISLTLFITIVWFFKIDLSAILNYLKSLFSGLNITFPKIELPKFAKKIGKIDNDEEEDKEIEILSAPDTDSSIDIDDRNIKTSLDSPREPIIPIATTYDDDDDKYSVPIEDSSDRLLSDIGNGSQLDDDGGDISDASIADPSLTSGNSVDLEISGIVIEDIEPPKKPYILPTADILSDPPAKLTDIDKIWVEEKGIKLIKTLEEFKVIGCKVAAARQGPVVTQFEITLASGVGVRKIVNLQDDLALKVGGKAIRIQAPIPGKAAVGIEIPNDKRENVYFKDVLTSNIFQNSKAALPVIVGKSISGAPLVEDISKMPHLLVAGQTGAGKSVGINSFIASLLFSKTPDELRLILIDPKKVEMACYAGIPHLMSPVVTEPEKAVAALQWAVREMEYRYSMLAKVGAKNIISFNERVEDGRNAKFVEQGVLEEHENAKLPYVVVIIDELADLMMTAAKEVEALVQRLAQLARAIGIHLIVATQRPSVDIITGPIKANLTSRISFRTIQSQDSKTILGSVGSEKLLGMGDMLYLKNGAPVIERYHGTFISEDDVDNLVGFIKNQNYRLSSIDFKPAEDKKSGKGSGKTVSGDVDDRDEMFEEAARLIVTNGIGSTSMLQRKLKLGFSRAGRIMDQLCDAGIVGEPQGSKAREILIEADVLEDMF